MAGGKGKSSGGKSSGGKTSAEGAKKQQSHSARAGLQVSFRLFESSSILFFAFRRAWLELLALLDAQTICAHARPPAHPASPALASNLPAMAEFDEFFFPRRR